MSESAENKKFNGKLVYCAVPERLSGLKDEIVHFVASQGNVPCFSVDGGDHVSEFDFNVMVLCDEFWFFGVSLRTFSEIKLIVTYNRNQDMARRIRVRHFHRDFDPEHEEYIRKCPTGPLD